MPGMIPSVGRPSAGGRPTLDRDPCANVRKRPWSEVKLGRLDCWNGDLDAAIQTLIGSGEDWYSALLEISGKPVPIGELGMKSHGLRVAIAEPRGGAFTLTAPFKPHSPIIAEGEEFSLYGIWSPPLLPGGPGMYDTMVSYKGGGSAYWYGLGNMIFDAPTPMHDNILRSDIVIESGSFDHVFPIFEGATLPAGDYRLTAKVRDHKPPTKVLDLDVADEAISVAEAFELERVKNQYGSQAELSRNGDRLELWNAGETYREHGFRFQVVPAGQVRQAEVEMVMAFLGGRW